MEPNQNQPTQNPAPTNPEFSGSAAPTPPPTPASTTAQTNPPQQNLNSGANATGENKGQAGGKDKKKMAVIGILVLIILMIVAVVGYYAYSAMSSGNSEETPVNTITQPPTPTTGPTVPPNPIQGEEDLNEVIDEIDQATDEAMMEEEVQGLQSDSNF